MQEIYAFETDLGELGVVPASRDGYRYLRAYVTDTAKSVLDAATCELNGKM